MDSRKAKQTRSQAARSRIEVQRPCTPEPAGSGSGINRSRPGSFSEVESTALAPEFVRNTRQRQAILAAFAETDRPLKPEEVWRHASKKIRRMGIATVYRALRTCVEQGVLVPVSVPGEAPRYERAGKEHHHHFLCRGCDILFEVHRCVQGVEGGAPSGFLVDDHHLTLFGICKECRSTP